MPFTVREKDRSGERKVIPVREIVLKLDVAVSRDALADSSSFYVRSDSDSERPIRLNQIGICSVLFGCVIARAFLSCVHANVLVIEFYELGSSTRGWKVGFTSWGNWKKARSEGIKRLSVVLLATIRCSEFQIISVNKPQFY